MGRVYNRQREGKGKLATVFGLKCFDSKMRDLGLDLLVTSNSETVSFDMKGFYKVLYPNIFFPTKKSSKQCGLQFSKER